MGTRRGIFLILLAALLFSVLSGARPSFAAAASGYGIDAMLDRVQNLTTPGSGAGMMDTVLKYARNLFIALATLSLILGLVRMLLSGESNLGTLAALLAKWVLYVGIFSWIMSNNIPKTLINSFVQIGGAVNSNQTTIAPDNILSAGIRMYGTLVQRGWEAGWGDFIGVTLLGVIILVVIAMIAGLFALALIEMHLVICGGAVLLGFGGFDFTRDIALSYIRYAISVGLKLVMVMLLYRIANELIPNWESTFSKATDMKTLITAAGQILGGTICILMAVRHVPAIAQAVVNRASMTLGHPVYTVNHTPYPQMSPTTVQSGGGLVRSMIDAMRSGHAPVSGGGTGPGGGGGGAPASGAAAVAHAIRGNDGMLTGGMGYTSVGSQQTAHPVQNPANAASMEHYVAAEKLMGGSSASRGMDSRQGLGVNVSGGIPVPSGGVFSGGAVSSGGAVASGGFTGGTVNSGAFTGGAVAGSIFSGGTVNSGGATSGGGALSGGAITGGGGAFSSTGGIFAPGRGRTPVNPEEIVQKAEARQAEQKPRTASRSRNRGTTGQPGVS